MGQDGKVYSMTKAKADVAIVRPASNQWMEQVYLTDGDFGAGLYGKLFDGSYVLLGGGSDIPRNYYGVLDGVDDYTTNIPGFSISEYKNGSPIYVEPKNDNTGIVSLNINGIGAFQVFKFGGADMQPGDFISGNRYELLAVKHFSELIYLVISVTNLISQSI